MAGVVFGALKQAIGLFLAVYIIGHMAGGSQIANEPVHQFLAVYGQMMPASVAGSRKGRCAGR